MKILKPLLLILIIAPAALTCLTFASTLSLLGQGRVRHIDPEAVAETPILPEALMAFYVDTLGLSGIERYGEAAAQLNSTSWFYVPAGLELVVSKLNYLSGSVNSELASTESHISRTLPLIDADRLQEARAELGQASGDLSQAERGISDITSAAKQLAAVLRTPSGKLMSKVKNLQSLADRYAERIRSLSSLIDELTSSSDRPLILSTLTIQISVPTVWLGQELDVNGSLTSPGGALSQRTISVYLNWEVAAEAVTDGKGNYRAVLKIPYLYEPSAALFSVFSPAGSDFARYSPCSSKALNVTLQYYKSVLSVLPLPKVLPGRSFTMLGSISSQGGPMTARNITLAVFGTYESTLANEAGNFKFSVPMPPQLLGGSWPATVVAPADGLLSPASASLVVNVERIQSRLEVEAPGQVLCGSDVTFTGRIDLEDDLAENITITAAIGSWAATTERLGSGPFEVQVHLPFGALTGNYEYVVTSGSDQPWFSPSSRASSIFVLNPVTVAMPLLTVSVAAIVFRDTFTQRRKKEVPRETAKKAAEKAAEEPEVPLGEDLRALYWITVHAISARTDINMSSHQTIRDYIVAVTEALGDELALFTQLSLAYEKSLYGKAVPAAEQLQARLAFQELHKRYAGSLSHATDPELGGTNTFQCAHCGNKLPPASEHCSKCGRPARRT